MTARLQLALDASAGPASVALFRDAVLLGGERLERTGSAEQLAPSIARLLHAAAVDARDLTDIIVGAGPGSFTGLRVAAALAKGLARGANATLHAVPSLPLIVTARDHTPVGRFVCVLDALRGEWFAQVVTHHDDGRWTVDGPVQRIAIDAVQALASSLKATVLGPPVDAMHQPDVRGAMRIAPSVVARDPWEPDYGRLAEAQVVWETANARPLPTS